MNAKLESEMNILLKGCKFGMEFEAPSLEICMLSTPSQQSS